MPHWFSLAGLRLRDMLVDIISWLLQVPGHAGGFPWFLALLFLVDFLTPFYQYAGRVVLWFLPMSGRRVSLFSCFPLFAATLFSASWKTGFLDLPGILWMLLLD